MDQLTEEIEREKKRIARASGRLTRWIGSPSSLILHTIFFVVMLVWGFLGNNAQEALLVLTTIVSLEAIYLSIFIQMTVNRHSEDLEEVSEDIGEIQEDVEDIQEDVDEIQKDVDDIQEDVEDIQETDQPSTVKTLSVSDPRFEKIEATMQTLLREITDLKKHR